LKVKFILMPLIYIKIIYLHLTYLLRRVSLNLRYQSNKPDFILPPVRGFIFEANALFFLSFYPIP